MKKHIIKIAAFLVGFLLINLLLCGFMPPDNGSSLAMWRNYHSKDSVDIAVIGSSLASCALPEEELAAATGKSVALMATNSQSWDMSKIALESVLREHTPQYVILVMDLSHTPRRKRLFSLPSCRLPAGRTAPPNCCVT